MAAQHETIPERLASTAAGIAPGIYVPLMRLLAEGEPVTIAELAAASVQPPEALQAAGDTDSRRYYRNPGLPRAPITSRMGSSATATAIRTSDNFRFLLTTDFYFPAGGKHKYLAARPSGQRRGAGAGGDSRGGGGLGARGA